MAGIKVGSPVSTQSCWISSTTVKAYTIPLTVMLRLRGDNEAMRTTRVNIMKYTQQAHVNSIVIHLTDSGWNMTGNAMTSAHTMPSGKSMRGMMTRASRSMRIPGDRHITTHRRRFLLSSPCVSPGLMQRSTSPETARNVAILCVAVLLLKLL